MKEPYFRLLEPVVKAWLNESRLHRIVLDLAKEYPIPTERHDWSSELFPDASILAQQVPGTQTDASYSLNRFEPDLK